MPFPTVDGCSPLEGQFEEASDQNRKALLAVCVGQAQGFAKKEFMARSWSMPPTSPMALPQLLDSSPMATPQMVSADKLMSAADASSLRSIFREELDIMRKELLAALGSSLCMPDAPQPLPPPGRPSAEPVVACISVPKEPVPTRQVFMGSSDENPAREVSKASCRTHGQSEGVAFSDDCGSPNGASVRGKNRGSMKIDAVEKIKLQHAAEMAAGNNRASMDLSGMITSEHTRIKSMVHYFEKGVEIVILLSFFHMGLCAQWTNLAEGPGNFCESMEHVYCAIFVVELVVKVTILRWEFVNSRLNLVDCVVVLTAVLDSWITPFFDAQFANLAWLRVVRLMRLLRMVKVLKIKRELYVLVQGIVGSLKALVWIMVLMGITLYVFALLFQDVLQMSRGTESYFDYNRQENVPYNISQIFFPNLITSMFTLWGICIGAIWLEVLEPVRFAQPYLVPIFMAFFALTSFGLLNVIIGVLTEKTAEAAKKHQDEDNLVHKQEKLNQVEELAMLLEDIDNNGDGTLTLREMEQCDGVAELMDTFNLPAGFVIRDMFMMIDVDGSGECSPEEFMLGMIRCIMSDDFQKTCMMRLGFGRIMNRLHELGQEISALTASQKENGLKG